MAKIEQNVVLYPIDILELDYLEFHHINQIKLFFLITYLPLNITGIVYVGDTL